MGTESPPSAAPDQDVGSSLSLNPIELALIAELSLEQARAHEEVADDVNQRPETRRTASAVAAAWRDRARMFQLQARQRNADPMLPEWRSLLASGRAYTGPERRREMRRAGSRRTGAATVGERDRRAGLDRRQRDRRRPAASSR